MEEQILVAAGIEVAVEGLKNVKSFGSVLQNKSMEDLSASTSQQKHYESPTPSPTSDEEEVHIESELSMLVDSSDDSDEEKSVPIKQKPIYKVLPKKIKEQRETKTTLIKKI